MKEGVSRLKTVCYVTGVAGWLGSQVARDLLDRGYAVRGLVLPGDKSAQKLPEAVDQVEGDVTRPEDIARFLEAGEERDRIVIHCAAIITMSIGPVSSVHQVNVEGTRHMIEACAPLHVRRFIYVSSVHAIPERPRGETVTEVRRFDPARVYGAYAKSKAEATQLVLDAYEALRLPAVVLHPSGICGPGDSAIGNLSQMFIDYFEGRLSFGVEGGYSFSDVRDISAAVVRAIEEGRVGECYILASHYVTIREILRLAHEVSGHREVRRMLPLWVAKAFAPLVGLYYRLRGQKPVVSAYALYTLNSNGDFSHEKASRELGYQPRPFRDTVRDTIHWLKDQGLIRFK